MGVKHGRWHWGRNAGWGCLRIGCWGKYLDLRGTSWQGNGESCITRSCLSRDRNAGWGDSVKNDNSSIERVEEFKYLGILLTDQNSIQEEIKSRLKLGNACYHSVLNLLSSRLLSKNLKIKIHKTIILPVVLYGCETWSLTLREERRLRVFENRVLR
jgi:hypothetical protein